jgi:hypothetical protein
MHLARIPVLLLALAAAAGHGCTSKNAPGPGARVRVGGPCTYKDTPGTATIVSVGAGAPDAKVEVRYDFEAAEAGASKKNVRLSIGDGANPPRHCVDSQGITVGSRHKALRSDIQRGTCTPVIFQLVDFKQDPCFPKKP